MDQQNLIKIDNAIFNGEEIPTVNARDLHVFMGVNTRFNDWIQFKIEQAKLSDNLDFVSFTENSVKPLGGRPNKEYRLTLDAAKHIAMLEGNNKGREARQYFIEFEKKARKLLEALPKTDDEIIAQGYILVQKRLVELKEQHARLQIENRHNEERIQYLEVQKNVRATETEIIAAPERIKECYNMSSFVIAQNHIYREFLRWTGINLKNKWHEAKKAKGQSGLKLYEYLTKNGLADKYMQIVNSLINNAHAGTHQNYPEQQEKYFE